LKTFAFRAGSSNSDQEKSFIEVLCDVLLSSPTDDLMSKLATVQGMLHDSFKGVIKEDETTMPIVVSTLTRKIRF
jgi:hypothetical protein